MTRPTADLLRAAADRIDALPADVPDPGVEVNVNGYVLLHWASADEGTARSVIAALPCDWTAGSRFLWAHLEPMVTAWIHFAIVEPVEPEPVVDPAALLAEVSA